MAEIFIKSFFTGIQNELLTKISQAKDEILIAVAWFTNRELFDGLLSSLDRGVKCSCLLHNDIINRNEYNLNFSKFIEKGGELRFYQSDNGLMHNKFCIIDNQILYTGSYNWTYSAEYKNKESLISTNDSLVCSDFLGYFNELWNLYPPVESYQALGLKNIFDTSFQSVKNELREEYGIMAEKSIVDGQILKKLDIINGLTSSTDNINKPIRESDKIRLKFNIGMRCRIDGVANQTLNIVKMGTILPIQNAFVRVTNLHDYPEKMTCELLLGNNDNADENITLCKLINGNLPKMEAMKLNMRAIVDIDATGYIKLKYECMNNKHTVYTTILAPDIVEKNKE